jgi:hypothetical protein
MPGALQTQLALKNRELCPALRVVWRTMLIAL